MGARPVRARALVASAHEAAGGRPAPRAPAARGRDDDRGARHRAALRGHATACAARSSRTPHRARTSSPTALRTTRSGCCTTAAHSPSAALELMIEAVDRLDGRATLDLVLLPARTRVPANGCGRGRRRRPNARFLEPMPDRPSSPRRPTSYDAGRHLLSRRSRPTSSSRCRTSSSTSSRRVLALVIGPSPEMARIVREFDCGVVADGFTVDALARRPRRAHARA